MNKIYSMVLVFSLLILGGCSQSASQYRFYTLAATANITTTPLPFTLGVAPVMIPGWLDQTNLVWSDGDVQLHTQSLDRWAEPLPDAMTRILTQDFGRRFDGGRVGSGPWARSERPDRVVSVSILSVSQSQGDVVMDVCWSISDEEKQMLNSRCQLYSQSAGTIDDAVEYVQALSRLLSQVSGDVAVYLSNQKNNDK